MRLRPLIAAAAIATAALGAGACSHPVAYTPAAYGEPGYCYYVDSPAEAISARRRGFRR